MSYVRFKDVNHTPEINLVFFKAEIQKCVPISQKGLGIMTKCLKSMCLSIQEVFDTSLTYAHKHEWNSGFLWAT